MKRNGLKWKVNRGQALIKKKKNASTCFSELAKRAKIIIVSKKVVFLKIHFVALWTTVFLFETCRSNTLTEYWSRIISEAHDRINYNEEKRHKPASLSRSLTHTYTYTGLIYANLPQAETPAWNLDACSLSNQPWTGGSSSYFAEWRINNNKCTCSAAAPICQQAAGHWLLKQQCQ